MHDIEPAVSYPDLTADRFDSRDAALLTRQIVLKLIFGPDSTGALRINSRVCDCIHDAYDTANHKRLPSRNEGRALSREYVQERVWNDPVLMHHGAGYES